MNAFSLDDQAGAGSQPWQRETVQAFFEAVAWDGRSRIAVTSLGAAPRSESAMTMTVSEFFQTITWDGQPIVGVPIAPLAAAPAPVDTDLDLTLDGFSDLFG